MSPARDAGLYLAGLRGLIRGPKSRTAPVEQQVTDPKPEQCCVCGSPDTPYENYREQLFCWPCANCPCGQTPCVRTGINDPTTSRVAIIGEAVAYLRASGEHFAAGLLDGFFSVDTPGADDLAGCAGCAGCGGPDCVQRPEPSGPDPDPTRTDPDTTQHGAADQGGHDPDDLRNRIAAALIARIKQAVIPTVDPLRGQIGSLFAATEYDLADAVLAVVQPIIDQLAPAQARVHALQQQLNDAHRTYDAADSLRYAMGHFRVYGGPLVQPRTEQQTSDPQRVDESDSDTCHVVYVDGESVRVHGDGDMAPDTSGFFAEVVRAAKRKYAAEHPDDPNGET